MRDFTVKIPAGQSIEAREKGSYFLIKSTTTALKVYSSDQSIRLASVDDGQGFLGRPFTQLQIENPSASEATVTYIIGDGNTLIDAVQVAGSVAITPASGYTAGSDATVTTTPETLTLPTGATGVTFMAGHANTQLVTVAGIPLDAGQPISLDLAAGTVITYVAASGTQALYWSITTA